MELSVERWEGPEAVSESVLQEIYRSEGMSPYSWSNGPGDCYSPHSHGYHKVIYVLRGSITWILPELDKRIETGPGDRMDLPRGTVHAAEVGPQGVTCLEGHI
jgi:quercetin dioxygenase-like cupin family protein